MLNDSGSLTLCALIKLMLELPLNIALVMVVINFELYFIFFCSLMASSVLCIGVGAQTFFCPKKYVQKN